MATVPISGTNVSLLRNVPFSSDYKDTRYFDNKTAQTAYFNSKPALNFSSMNFQRIEGRHYIKVPKHIDDLWGYTYLKFQNAQYNNKWFYAFITKLEYAQGNNTFVYFEIDEIQTWWFDVTIKPSFIERQHLKMFDANGYPLTHTVDEGLDYGTEYDINTAQRFTPYGPVRFLVMVTKQPLHGDANKPDATVNGVPQPLTYYLHPFYADNTTPTCKIDGAGDYPLAQPTYMLDTLAKDEDAVNNIVALYVTDIPGVNVVRNENSGVLNFQNVGGQEVEYVQAGSSDATPIFTFYVKSLQNYMVGTINIGDKYSGFSATNTRGEGKLWNSPYFLITITDYKGNQIDVKPEYITGNALDLKYRGTLGLSNYVSYGVDRYNSGGASLTGMNMNLIDQQPQDLPILNEYLTAFLQGNRNSLQVQKDSALLSIAQNASQGVVAVGGSIASPIGTVAGGTNAALTGIFGVAQGLQQIKGLEAKQKDIANVPPSIQKEGSNSYYNFGYLLNGVTVQTKQIKPEYRKKLADYFHMYGYKFHEVAVPNFHTRQHFNFVKTVGANVIGSINNEDLNIIKNILNNGITFWHTDDIGNYNLENNEVS